MRIILLSDIHMAVERLSALVGMAEKPIDLAIVAGDLTNFGRTADVRRVADCLHPLPFLTIPGNLDTPEVEQYLVEQAWSIHGGARTVQGWTFIGFGGGATGFVGDILYTDEQIEAAVTPLLRAAPAAMTMLVTHQPPFDTNLDRVGGVLPRGSKSIRRLIETYQPRYQICGHIHESWGEDRLGDTRCYNIAAVKEGRAAVLDLGEGTFTRLLVP